MMTFLTFLLGIQLYIFFVDKDKIIINAKDNNINKLDGRKSQNILEKMDEITDVILEYKIKHKIDNEVILEIETKINRAKIEFTNYFSALKYLRKIYRYKISLTQDYIAIFDTNIYNNNFVKILSGITTLGLSIYSAIYFMFGHITDPKSGLFFPWLSKKVNMETAHCIIEYGFYIILFLFMHGIL